MNYKEILSTYQEVISFSHKDKEKIIDYIILLYDKDSPLIQLYSELTYRKTIACEKVGLNPESQLMQDIFCLKNDEVLAIIDCFLQKIQCNYTFESMISDMEIFSEFQRSMRKPVPDFEVDPDKQLKAIEMKSKLSSQSKILVENIKSYMNELYGHDSLLKDTSQKRVRTTVENMAKKV